ncbi:hypothetical protein ACIG3E_23440 [Streptomyces sp. NPDC053474]|uniref:hypothetical protein n=1 Tax=Streptomyces sp. NPDC053474 TaxID=3365704 RepID=UPI0037CF1DB7
MHTHQPLAAAGIIDDFAGLGGDIKTLLASVVLGIMYLCLVIMTGFTSRSFLKTLVAAVGGGIVLGVVASQTVLSSKTSEELKKNHTVGAPAPAAVVRLSDLPKHETLISVGRPQ